MKRMYVIKKGSRYVKNDGLNNSFTKFLDRACVYDKESEAMDLSFPDEGEVIVKVTKNKQGKLVEVK